MSITYGLLKVLDNATASGLILFVAAMWIGPKIYKHQKDVDRIYLAQEKLAERLFMLLEHSEEVNRYFDRMANTYMKIIEMKDKSGFELFRDKVMPEEITKVGELLMTQLPDDLSKIESVSAVYFGENKNIKDGIKKIFDEFNIWHTFITYYPMGKASKPFVFDKRIKDIPEFSLEALEKVIRDLIKVSFKLR